MSDSNNATMMILQQSDNGVTTGLGYSLVVFALSLSRFAPAK